MRYAAIGVVVVALGWFLLSRGSDAQAVTACLENAGAEVVESERFAQVFPYAIALRSVERVQSYPELDGAHFYFVLAGSDRAMLFVGKGEEQAAEFETTLRTMVEQEGNMFWARRAGNALLVWERPASWPSLDACIE